MKILAITCLTLLASCGPKLLDGVDIEPCDGWTGARPTTEQQFARAALAEAHGRKCANSKLIAVGELTGRFRVAK